MLYLSSCRGEGPKNLTEQWIGLCNAFWRRDVTASRSALCVLYILINIYETRYLLSSGIPYGQPHPGAVHSPLRQRLRCSFVFLCETRKSTNALQLPWTPFIVQRSRRPNRGLWTGLYDVLRGGGGIGAGGTFLFVCNVVLMSEYTDIGRNGRKG